MREYIQQNFVDGEETAADAFDKFSQKRGYEVKQLDEQAPVKDGIPVGGHSQREGRAGRGSQKDRLGKAGMLHKR